MFCCCVIVINPNIPSRLIFCEPAQLSRSVYCSLSIERARAHSLPRERERVSATPRSSVPFSCLCVFGLFFCLSRRHSLYLLSHPLSLSFAHPLVTISPLFEIHHILFSFFFFIIICCFVFFLSIWKMLVKTTTTALACFVLHNY